MLVVIARSCNPFSADRGARRYKTGDLARYRSDVTIEFAGRPDDQIQLRGFCNELRVIEASLHEARGETAPSRTSLVGSLAPVRRLGAAPYAQRVEDTLARLE
jgi:hypothetical protein